MKYYLLQDPTVEIIATARSPSKATELNNLADEYAGRLHIVELDVDKDESVKAFAAGVENLVPRVDVLINNAGITVRKNLEEL